MTDAHDIEAVARRLLGMPNPHLSTKAELRFGAHGSISVVIAGEEAGSWYDHENQVGGGIKELLKYKGIDDLFERRGGQRDVIRYAYRDEQGELLFWVCRGTPKKFWQEQPGPGRGGVMRDAEGKRTMQGARLVPYRLPDIVAARRNRNGHPPRVYLVEGEKDADKLGSWGLVASCNPGGAGKWRAEYSPHFAGCDIVIIPDNDDAGRDHVVKVARSVAPHAESVKLLTTITRGLDEKGDISDWIADGGTQSTLEDLVDATPVYEIDDISNSEDLETDEDDGGIICEQLEPLPITAIPPRPWAYGHFLLTGYASVLGAVDGGGKGAQAVVIALSTITGRELLGEKVWRTGPVVIVSYEDDKMEWRRRIAAACLVYGIDYDEVIRSFYFISRPRTQIAFAARLATSRGESKIGFPDSAAIIALLKRIKPALMIVDPFNRAHSLEDGNSNVMIALVAGEIQRIVAEACCAGLVLHHLRKGATGEVDDLMGATALRSTFRATRVLLRMTREEAEGFDLPPAEAYRYSRIASSKENYTKPEKARWYLLESIDLGNTAVDPIYPDGDNVQVIRAWSPPDAFDGLAKSAIAEIFKAFRDGPGEGEFYSAHGSATHKATDVIVRLGDKTADEARRILSKWKENRVVAEDTYVNPQRNRRSRVTVDEDKARAILGSLYQPAEEAP